MSFNQPSSVNESPAPASGDALWFACIEQLAQELPEQQFNTWIRPLTAHIADDFSKIVISVGNRFKLDWIRAQYAARISSLLQQLYGQPLLVELVITPKIGQITSKPISFTRT